MPLDRDDNFVPIQDSLGAPAGFQVLVVSSTAVALSIQGTADGAVISLEGNKVWWRDDGTSPTAQIAMPMNITDVLTIDHTISLSQIEFIRDTADATAYISYYRRI